MHSKSVPDEICEPDVRTVGGYTTTNGRPYISALLQTAYDRGHCDGVRLASIVWAVLCVCVAVWGLVGRTH